MNQNGEPGIENSIGGQSIQFPALCFSHGFVNVIHSLDALTQTNRLGFKSGYHRDLTLVDSAGDRFHVVGAKKIRTLPFKLTFKDFLAFLGANPRWQIELIFRPGSSQITLDELKELISGSFKKEKYYWEEMSDFDDFKRGIESARSVQGVFEVFTDFNKA